MVQIGWPHIMRSGRVQGHEPAVAQCTVAAGAEQRAGLEVQPGKVGIGFVVIGSQPNAVLLCHRGQRGVFRTVRREAALRYPFRDALAHGEASEAVLRQHHQFQVLPHEALRCTNLSAHAFGGDEHLCTRRRYGHLIDSDGAGLQAQRPVNGDARVSGCGLGARGNAGARVGVHVGVHLGVGFIPSHPAAPLRRWRSVHAACAPRRTPANSRRRGQLRGWARRK